MGEQGEESTRTLGLGHQSDEVLGAGRKERGMGASGYKVFHFSGRSGEAICRKEMRSPGVQAGIDLLHLKTVHLVIFIYVLRACTWAIMHMWKSEDNSR